MHRTLPKDTEHWNDQYLNTFHAIQENVTLFRIVAQCVQNGKNGKKILSLDRATCALTHDSDVCTGRSRVGCNRGSEKSRRTLSVASSPPLLPPLVLWWRFWTIWPLPGKFFFHVWVHCALDAHPFSTLSGVVNNWCRNEEKRKRMRVTREWPKSHAIPMTNTHTRCY